MQNIATLTTASVISSFVAVYAINEISEKQMEVSWRGNQNPINTKNAKVIVWIIAPAIPPSRRNQIRLRM